MFITLHTTEFGMLDLHTTDLGMFDMSVNLSTAKSSDSGYNKGPKITGTLSCGKSVKYKNSSC